MPLERRSPLPPGRYWLNVKMPGLDGGVQQGAFQAWVGRMNAGSSGDPSNRPVQITHTEEGPSDGFSFYIFQILRPVPRWPDSAGLGFPDIAGPNIRSQADTVQRPDPVKDLPDRIDDALDSAKDKALGSVGPLVMFAAVGLALFMFVKVVKK